MTDIRLQLILDTDLLKVLAQTQDSLQTISILNEHFANADLSLEKLTRQGPFSYEGKIEYINNNHDWFPYQLEQKNGHISVNWIYIKDADFSLPFFADTFTHLLNIPFIRWCQFSTSVDSLLTYAQQCKKNSLFKAIFFHTSRCGSTLVCQGLNKIKETLVFSEPEPIDFVIRKLSKQLSSSEKISLLQALETSWSHILSHRANHFYLKSDCWHIHAFELFQDAFSEAKKHFIYRNMHEVIASQIRQPAAFLVPSLVSPHWYGLEHPEGNFMSPTGYVLDIISSFFKKAQDFTNKGELLTISYPDLSTNKVNQLIHKEHITDDLSAHIRSINVHAKNQQSLFSPDSAEKGEFFNEEIKAIIQKRQSENFNLH